MFISVSRCIRLQKFREVNHSLNCNFYARFHTSSLLLESKLNSIPIEKTRNIGIIAHIDAGKTTTTERMLYDSGRTFRAGNVDEGDTVTDYLPSERERGITIQLAATSIGWNNNKINIIDTPGHADFTFEVTRSLRVLDGCVTILDAVAGVEAQTEKVWKQARALNIPKIAYINKMDRVGAGFSRCVKEIIQKLQTRVVLCNIPYFEKHSDDNIEFKGVIDTVHKKVLIWTSDVDLNAKKIEVHDLEEEKDNFSQAYEIARNCRESMVETLGELDESVVDSFLENNEDYMQIPSKTLTSSIRSSTISNEVTPVLCGSSFKNVGIQPLLDAVVSFLPSPLEISLPEISLSPAECFRKKKKNQKKELSVVLDKKHGLIINNDRKLSTALAFKVITHPTRGVLTFFRVYSGKFLSNTMALNTRTGKKINLRKLLLMHGEDPEIVPYISSGNIGVISGTEDDVMTGDTLVSIGSNKNLSPLELSIKMLPIEIPPPLFNTSVEPFTAGDSRYVNQCIDVLLREDPSLKVSIDEDLGQTVLSGMGELHLEIVRDRLIRDMKANLRTRDVAVSYKETLTKPLPLPITQNLANNENVSVEIELDSFSEEVAKSSYKDDENAVVLEQENNVIVFEPNATPEYMFAALEERRWKCDASLEELQDALISGCVVGLQLGGPVLGLPLHSMVVRIKRWNFPVDSNAETPASLLEIGRKAITKAVHEVLSEESFGVLEPHMSVKVYVNSDSLGDVVHDLTQRCQAVISSIDDESEDLDATNWANEESDKVYLPPDYTMAATKTMSSVKNKKIISAEVSLRDMIGYLSKLRSITQGRGAFDMSYLGMKVVPRSKLNVISGNI